MCPLYQNYNVKTSLSNSIVIFKVDGSIDTKKKKNKHERLAFLSQIISLEWPSFFLGIALFQYFINKSTSLFAWSIGERSTPDR